MGSFTPFATCVRPVSTPEDSCGYIMDEMYKTKKDEVFGTATPTSPVDVALPLTLKARKQDLDKLILPLSTVLPMLTHPWLMTADGRCQVVISRTGGPAMTSWFAVWLHLEATVAKCIRAGRGGRSEIKARR